MSEAPATSSVSVITACFNAVDTIDRTIESVRRQDPAVAEHIVVDGGSTDGTLERVEAHQAADPRITLLRGPDRGIADAWNKGLAKATGDWIGIINADDWYADDTLAQLQPYLGAEAILHGRMCVHDPASGRSKLFGPGPGEGAPAFRPDVIMPTEHATTFVPASVYRRIGGFNTAFRLAMDYDLLLRAHLDGVAFRYIPQVLANFTRGGLSAQDPLRGQREVLASKILNLNEVRRPIAFYARIRSRFWRRRLFGIKRK